MCNILYIDNGYLLQRNHMTFIYIIMVITLTLIVFLYTLHFLIHIGLVIGRIVIFVADKFESYEKRRDLKKQMNKIYPKLY